MNLQEYLNPTETTNRTDGVLALEKAARDRVAGLRSLWERLRGGRPFPPRSAFDMPTLQPWLTHIEIVEVHPQPDGGRRYRYRLVGTAINGIDGIEVTGRFADEVFGDLYRSVIEHYDRAMESRAPVESLFEIMVNRRGTTYRYCKLVLPLSTDGETVDMLLVYIEEVPGTILA